MSWDPYRLQSCGNGLNVYGGNIPLTPKLGINTFFLIFRAKNLSKSQKDPGEQLPVSSQLQPHRSLSEHQQRQQCIHPGVRGQPAAEKRERHRQPHPNGDGYKPPQPM